MRRTLLLTNDFPPRSGGIQSYLQQLAGRLPASDLVVYAPAWPGAAAFDAAQPFPVYRHPTSLMLPSPAVLRRAAEIIDRHALSAVWFGAAAPLALLSSALQRRGVSRLVASTHGHEVGWSMTPGGRQALRRIGNTTDVITYVSEYARARCAAAFGPQAGMEYLPPGVDTTLFRPDPVARQQIRSQYGLTDRRVVVCISRLVPRKGQDVLIAAMPEILGWVPDAALLLVGSGRRANELAAAARAAGLTDRVVLTGNVPYQELPGHYAAGDVFAMPCRTRGGGLDVEGLGIVFLEASASGLPVVAGNSGGAPETVQQDRTGTVVDGRDVHRVAQACAALLADRAIARDQGTAGRAWVTGRWNWPRSADRLAALLSG